MQNKLQNINKKRLVMTGLSLLVFVLWFVAVDHKSNVEVERVNVKISKISNKKNLITKKDVKNLFRGYLGYDLGLAKIEELDLRMLEQILVDDKRVRNAEVFIDANHVVNVYVQQRKPIVRVNDGETYAYYLDADMVVIPVMEKRAIRVPIATGAIENIALGLIEKKKTHLRDVYVLSKYIDSDKFLKSLVEQIHVKRSGEIIIIPKIGREKILLGDVVDMEENLKKLKNFYRNGLPKNGWDQFAELNLSYKNQIVAKQR